MIKYVGIRILIDSASVNAVALNKQGHIAVIARIDNFVIALNYTGAVQEDSIVIPVISKCNYFGSPRDAYDKYLHMIGKLSLKDPMSKYFGAPNFSEHLINGSCPAEMFDDVRKLVAGLLENELAEFTAYVWAAQKPIRR